MLKKLLGTLLCVSLLLSVAVNAAAADETIQLKFMLVLTETDQQYASYMQVIEDYNASNDLNVEIVPEIYENEQFKTKLVTLMASNNVPDIFFTWELDYMRPFVEAGRVADLTAYLEADADWTASFAGGTLEPLTFDGQVYGIPTQKNVCVVFYNKGIFAKNSIEVPTTYEEFIQACETLKTAGVSPLAMCGTDGWVPAQFVQQLANGIGGMDLYYGICNGERTWNDPDYIRAGLAAQELINSGYFQDSFIGMGHVETRQKFLDGEAGMYFMGNWDSAKVENALGEDAGAFILPAINAEYTNISVGSVGTCYSIAESSEYKDEAIDFIKYWTSQDVELYLLYESSRIPAGAFAFDDTQLTPMTSRIVELSNEQVGLTPWWDRAFGAGEGVEFNNTCIAVFGGEDVQEAFDALQQFAVDNAE